MFSPIYVRVYSNTNQWRSDSALVPSAGLAVFLHIGATDLIPQKFGASNLQGVSQQPQHTHGGGSHTTTSVPDELVPGSVCSTAMRDPVLDVSQRAPDGFVSVVDIPALCGVTSGS